MNDYRPLLEKSDPEVFAALAGEEQRQRTGLELIPSENYTYPEVHAAAGSVFGNKYAEGYPGRRYYGGQEFTDRIDLHRMLESAQGVIGKMDRLADIVFERSS